MIVLAGASLVLPDRIVERGSLVIKDGRIAAIEPRTIDRHGGADIVNLRDHVIVPGFIDAHVHGVEGIDVLDGPEAVAHVASRLPKYGVTGFCPTSIACAPQPLGILLSAVTAARTTGHPRSARVLPAHLESNFINPEWAGAQPAACLRIYKGGAHGTFTGDDIMRVIAGHRASVGIVTVAPELDRGIDLVRDLVKAGHRVSLGHSGATYEQARAAIDAGASQATHLFNRMSSMTARAPGVVGAVLESDAVAAELICDGFHVHPSLMAMAIRLKTSRRMMAITDATAGAGLAPGTRTRLGDRDILVTDRCAMLEDGTVAGSVLSMDAAFRMLAATLKLPLTDAARMCATTPAERLGLADRGSIAEGQVADLVALTREHRVRQTYLAGVAALEP
ncbi:MAG TPA: N-acetylglucosamine-6-phosphate deacetylase [Vicinamibacterales bacterium]|nr:N-acetylglucosamine-6-phosphate deacetylase [Vicinamibacterales bacterium]